MKKKKNKSKKTAKKNIGRLLSALTKKSIRFAEMYNPNVSEDGTEDLHYEIMVIIYKLRKRNVEHGRIYGSLNNQPAKEYFEEYLRMKFDDKGWVNKDKEAR